MLFSRRVERIPKAIGTMMATAAVLLIHIESTAVAKAMARNKLAGLELTHFSDSNHNAQRLSILWTTKASARKKLPIKRKIIGWAKAENTDLTVPSPATTQKAAPKKDVTAKGRASVIHDITTQARILANKCALTGRFGKGIR